MARTQFTTAATKGTGPALTRETYIELLGGAFPAVCGTEPQTLSIEQMDGHTRELVRLRVLSDKEAIAENPELGYLKALAEDFAEPTNLTVLGLYKRLAVLDERIQYNFGPPPFIPSELQNMDEVLKKFPVAEAKAYVDDLYQKTLAFYTHTEAFVLKPDDMKQGEKRPAIIVSHQHNAQYKNGKSETVGIEIEGQGNSIHATANDLVKEGYIVVAYDQLGFESRQHPVRQGLTWERWRSNGLEQRGKTLLRAYLSDAMQVVDYMEGRGDIDSKRIGAYGHSLGSWVTANLAVLDDRIKAAVANCGFPTVEGLEMFPEQYHCEPHSIPGIHKFGGFQSIFQTRKAPLKLHMNFGGLDVLNLLSGRVIDAGSAALNGKGNGSSFTSFVDEFQAHTNSPAMQANTLALFRRALSVVTPAPARRPANDLNIR